MPRDRRAEQASRLPILKAQQRKAKLESLDLKGYKRFDKRLRKCLCQQAEKLSYTLARFI